MVWACSMGDTGLPLREVTPFQPGGASKHKLMSYDDCRFEAQGPLVLQNCRAAHFQSSGHSIMFKNEDLRTVQEYDDKVYGITRKLAEDQESASFNSEKRDLASSAAIAGSRRGLRGRSLKRLRRQRPMS